MQLLVLLVIKLKFLSSDAGSVHEDTPGLAHLVEHMIFFGSVKYPDGKLYTELVLLQLFSSPKHNHELSSSS